MSTINAAGTVPWRRLDDGRIEVALVHRPKYDDWSWTKGKLEPDEPWAVAAVRETAEETGLAVRLGLPLPPTAYRVLDRLGRPATKHVRYWAAEVLGGAGDLEHEIDEVRWLDPIAATERLDYVHDREQLRAILRADRRGDLSCWPLAIVRHSQALPRSAWHHPDPERPLTELGVRQAAVAGGVLAAYGIERLVTSPSVRCVDTLAPYAARLGRALEPVKGLSEEGFESRGPKRAVRAVRTLLHDGTPAALCSHGPVLPTVLGALLPRMAPAQDQIGAAEATLVEATDLGMDKGEVLLAHVVGLAEQARIVAVERIPPLDD